MLPSLFATPGSGALADKIGWINYGSLTLIPNTNPIHIINSLPDGYTVEFDLSLQNVSGPLTNFNAVTPPSYFESAFGQTGYTNIGGNVVLYSNYPQSGDANEVIQMNNITVKNSKNIITTTYKWVFADAEATQKAESIKSSETNGSPWILLTNLPPVSGNPANSPTISGINTNTVTLTGTGLIPNYPSGPVFISNNPTNINTTFPLPSLSKEGVAFGIIVNDREQSISDLVESVALEEAALSHIINAEGEKIQAALRIGNLNQIIKINDSINNLLKSVSRLDNILINKLKIVDCYCENK